VSVPVGKPRNLSLSHTRWGIEIDGTEALPAGTAVLVRTSRGAEFPAVLGEVAHTLPASIVYRRIDRARDCALEAIRAWNLLCRAPTTRQVAEYCGWTMFRAVDELHRLRQRDEAWSTLIEGPTRRWHLKESQSRRGGHPGGLRMPEPGDDCNAQDQRARG